MRIVIPHSVVAVFLLVSGCGVEDSSTSLAEATGSEADVGYTSDASGTSPDAIRLDDSATPGGCEVAVPGADTDGDGIQDVIEDRNLNCVVDPGETDPLNEDTDGDGLLDGEEDLDRNGEWDAERGEFSATQADTDQDGVLDGEEPAAALCVASVAGRSLRNTTRLADGRLVLVPAEWSVSTNPENDTIWAQSGAAAVAYLSGATVESWAASPLAVLAEIQSDRPDVRVQQVIASHGDYRWSQYQIETDSRDGPELVADLLGLELMESSDEDDRPSDSDGPESPDSNSRVFVEVAVDESASRATVAVYEGGDRPQAMDWYASPQRIAPRAGVTLRAYCTEQQPALEGLPVTVVVGDVRASNEEAVRAILGAIWSELESRGLLAGGFFAPADVHVTASLSSWINTELRYSFDEVLRLLLDLDSSTDDQRMWTNALALVAAVRAAGDADEPSVITLVVVGGTEDTSYRQGTYDGRDGDPSQPTIGAGPERDALDAYFAAELQRFDARLVAVGPDADHEAGCLSARRRDTSGAFDSSSYQRLARATGGAWIDGCQLPTNDRLAHLLRNRIPTAYLSVAGPDLAGILEVPGSDTLIQPAQSGLTSYAMSGTSESEIPLVRLVWEE